jgi:hypothetical protein
MVNIGVNLKQASYKESGRPFRNIAKTFNVLTPQAWSNPDVDTPWNTREDILYLDKYGYPQRMPDEDDAVYNSLGAELYQGIDGNYPGGKYRVSFNGDADLSFETYPGSHQTEILKHRYNPKTNITVYLLDHTPNENGLYFQIDDVNPDNPIKNLKIIHRGSEKVNNIFDGSFLETLEPYDDIRYLDWTKTNASREVEWKDRTHPKDISWGGGYPGETPVPWEHIINLSNLTDTNPWINIPHAATDEYISRLARMFANRLDDDLSVTVEYTNEPWGMPVQRQWLLEYANDNYVYSEPTGDSLKVADAYMEKAINTIQIFEKEFENVNKDVDRVIGSISGQSAWVNWTRRTLERALEFRFAENTINSDVSDEYVILVSDELDLEEIPDITGIDQLAVGFYFGSRLGKPENDHLFKGDKGIDNIFTEIFDGGLIKDKYNGLSALDLSRQKMTDYKRFADTYQIPLVAYEGGQHLSTWGRRDFDLIENFTEANRDPRMKDAYLEHFDNWEEIVGEDALFMHWTMVSYPSNTGYGSWGLEEYPDQRSEEIEFVPKLDAILSLI